MHVWRRGRSGVDADKNVGKVGKSTSGDPMLRAFAAPLGPAFARGRDQGWSMDGRGSFGTPR